MQRPIDKKLLAQWMWLSYYNEVLYQKGIITEREYGKMKLKIDRWITERR